MDLQKKRLTVQTCCGWRDLPAALARARNRIAEQVDDAMAATHAATMGPSGAPAPRPLVRKKLIKGNLTLHRTKLASSDLPPPPLPKT